MNEQRYKVEELFAVVPMEDYIASCIDIPRIESYCQACSNYGKIWSCPSFGFSVEELWSQYTTLELHARKICFSEQMQAVCYPVEELGWKSKEILRPEQERLLTALLDREENFAGSRALAAGSCDACYPGPCLRVQGKGCIHPEKMRYSLESLGADVSKTVSLYLHEEILWGKAGHLPPHYILVGGLLRK